MALQPIDKFCETLDPVVKNAVMLASVGSTVAREKILNAAYPEEGKTEHLRELANKIKSLKPSENLEKAVASLEANGVKVLFAKDAEEARNIILGILREKNAKNVVKVKSMTTEEIELNAFLEKNGVEAVETDLGELIIQIDGERPSHIVKPAIHRRRDDIAKSFEKHNIAPYDDEPTHITLNARKYLRKKYFNADVVKLRPRKRGRDCACNKRRQFKILDGGSKNAYCNSGLRKGYTVGAGTLGVPQPARKERDGTA